MISFFLSLSLSLSVSLSLSLSLSLSHQLPSFTIETFDITGALLFIASQSGKQHMWH